VQFERCGGVESAGTVAKSGSLRLGGIEYVRNGSVLEPTQKSQPGRLVLGILGDTKEALPATLSGLAHLAARFKQSGATAIILLGGIDSSFEGIRAVLASLRDAAPILVLPGDRESRSGFQAAVEALGPQIVDLTRVRALVAPGASLIALPGYHLPHHLLAREQGCSYDDREKLVLVELAHTLPPPRVLLAHGPPRGSGPHAVDRAFGGVNIGDPLLTGLLREGEIHFGFFSHVQESAGHAINRAGQIVAEGTWTDSLWLNVGSADSVPHEDLAGQWSKGSAALVEIEGGRARYRMMRGPY
jgi:hypothetical protein